MNDMKGASDASTVHSNKRKMAFSDENGVTGSSPCGSMDTEVPETAHEKARVHHHHRPPFLHSPPS